MDTILTFLGDLLTKAEFWSLSTLGVGTSSIVALLWTRKSNLALVASNVATKGIKAEMSDLKTANIQSTNEMSELKKENVQLKEQAKVTNDMIYILSQSVNIGGENKDRITSMYKTINKNLPEVKIVEVIKEVAVKSLTDAASDIKAKSSLDDLLKKL